MDEQTGQPRPGDHAWWAARPSTTTGARRGRPPVDLSRIVAAALEIVDEVGVPTFTMRMLADRLNSGTATLYRHFASKDEIMAYVLDLVLGEVEIEPADAANRTWQEAATAASDRLYQVLREHPNVLALFGSQIPVGPSALANQERVIALLLANGFEPELAARTFHAIAHYVVGFAIQQHSPTAESRDADDSAALYSSLDPATYPALVKAAPFVHGCSVDEEFHFGLSMLLAGIDELHGRSAPAPKPDPTKPDVDGATRSRNCGQR
jgi:AcrR family transcriptional regulator